MEADERYKDIDCVALCKRLTIYAEYLFSTSEIAGLGRVIQGAGVSPEDLAMGVMAEEIERARYHPKKGTLLGYLKVALANDFKDALRRSSFRTTIAVDPSITNEEPERSLRQVVADIGDKGSSAERIAFRAAALKLVERDEQLQEYIIAVLDIGAKKRQDVADLWRISPEEVTNRRKRLITLVGRARDSKASLES